MTTVTVNYSREQLEAMSYGMLKQQAKNVGMKWSGVKKVKLIEDLLAISEVEEVTPNAEVQEEVSVGAQAESQIAVEYEFLFTTAPSALDCAWSETIELLPIMNANNHQWRKVKVESNLVSEQKLTYLQDNHRAYSTGEFEQILSFQLPFKENLKLDFKKAVKKSSINKEVFIAPSGELKPAKPGTKVELEIKILRNGATQEQVCEALSWKCWSYSRSSVLKLGYGLHRDSEKKFWLVDPEMAIAS